MESKKVKVFNAYKSDDEDMKYYEDLGLNEFDYWNSHMKIINKNGLIKLPKNRLSEIDKFEPLEKNIEEVTKYEMDKLEEATLQMFKSSEEQARDLLDSAKRKRMRCEKLIIEKCCEALGIDVCNVYDGEHWDCNLSPMGHCIYRCDNGEPECIFCGQPEERK